MTDTVLLYQISLWLYVVGAAGSLMTAPLSWRHSLHVALASFFAGSLLLLYASGSALYYGKEFELSIVSSFPLVSFSLFIDRLSAFFAATFSFIAVIISIYSWDYARHDVSPGFARFSGFFFNLFFLAMILVIHAHDSLLFLLSWEMMTILSWIFVMQNYKDAEAQNAGWVYLLMAHLGTAFLILFFLFVSVKSGTTNFSLFSQGLQQVGLQEHKLLFFALLIGFGTKAGVFPLHIWLPKAHPAAPSHVSALMSGLMIKTAFYGFLRFGYCILNVPSWCGITLLLVGIFTAFIGILYASFCDDIKKVLAYTSIENTGLMLLPLGLAFLFKDAGNVSMANFCIATLLLQVFNHGLFKSFMFMSAGVVVSAFRTRSLHLMGGLAKVLPGTAFLFFCGAIAASGIPPMNGFSGKWLIFQNLISAASLPGIETKVIVLFCAALFGLVGAITALTFVRLYTAVFCGLPRGEQCKDAASYPFMTIALIFSALGCITSGVFPGFVLNTALYVTQSWGTLNSQVVKAGLSTITLHSDFALLSPAFVLVFLFFFFAVLYLISRFSPVRRAMPWTCGITPRAEFEFSPSGYAQPFEVVFSKFSPSHLKFLRAVFENHISSKFQRFNELLLSMQSGNMRQYLFYILITVVLLFLWVHL
jgi:hydrogenase-4 component B